MNCGSLKCVGTPIIEGRFEKPAGSDTG